MTLTEIMPALRQTSDGRVILTLRVQPGAKRDAVAGMYGEQAVKLAVSAPPVDGKANAAIRKLLAGWLGIPQGKIELKSGETGRDKNFIISGLTLEETANKLIQNAK